MKKRQLGASKVKITPIIFGAWAIGGWMWGGNDEKDSIQAIQASIDHGVTTIDTAPIYGMGYSEELVGKAIKGRRDQVVIATKCGMRWDSEEGSDPWPQKDNLGHDLIIRKNSEPKSIIYECEQSLKRLGIDAIDLYQIHWPDTSTALEKTWDAMNLLKQQGKVKAIRVSNYSQEWLELAHQLHPVDSIQPPYSLIRRKIEGDLLPFCLKNSIGVIVYSPLERGLLTGDVGPDRLFPPGDHRSNHKLFTKEMRQRVQKILQTLRPIAENHQASFAQLIINWTIHQSGITGAIVGARNAIQAEQNAKALDFILTDDELGKIRKTFDELSKDA